MIRNRFLGVGLALFWLTSMAGLSQQSPAGTSAQAVSASDPFSMDLESLLNIRVTTASKFSEKLSDAPSVISVVTKDELRRFGGITLLEILERVAGLNPSGN